MEFISRYHIDMKQFNLFNGFEHNKIIKLYLKVEII